MKSRDILEDEDWELAWDGLSNLQVETAKMFGENPDLFESLAETFPAQRYLEKVVSFARDTDYEGSGAKNLPRFFQNSRIKKK